LTYLHFDTRLLDVLFLRRGKPALVLDQTAQVFDLTGVAGVAADDTSESGAMGSLMFDVPSAFIIST